MALAIHNTTLTAGPISANNRDLLHTATAGSVLLVFLHSNEATAFSAVAAAGVAMTRLGAVAPSAGNMEVWGLTAPGAGVLTLSAIVVGNNPALYGMVAVSYVGQRTTATPFGGVVSGTATGTVINFTISADHDNLAVFAFGISASTTITLGNGTNRADVTHSTTGRMVVGDILAGPGTTVSLSASSGASGIWGMLGINLIASAVARVGLQFDAVAITKNATTSNSQGFLLTATAGAVLLFFANLDSVAAGASISAVNIGATQLTRLGAVNYKATNNQRIEIWGLTAPASGTLTISAALVGTTSAGWVMGAVTYIGQRTTATPFGNVASASFTATSTVALTIPSSANNLAVFAFGADDTGTLGIGTGATLRGTAEIALAGLAFGEASGAASVVISISSTVVSRWGMLGIDLIVSQTAVGAANPIWNYSLLGVG